MAEKGGSKRFINCRILHKGKLIWEDLLVRNGKIQDPEKFFFSEKGKAEEVIDCCGNILAPGFIDAQINGGFGVDFSTIEGDVMNTVQSVAKSLLQYGVTSFCPTIVTSDPEKYHKILPQLKKTRGGREGAAVLGVHLEGPFISKQKRGAHDLQHIREFPAGLHDLEQVYGDLGKTSIITLAPELQNSDKVIAALRKKGIVVSLGHSICNIEQGETAVQTGASFITHLFNAMLSFHHRDPGLVGLLTSKYIPQDRTLFFGLIADGIHTHPAALRIAQRVHPKGLVLVTDAIAAMGLGDGVHQLGPMEIEIHGRRAVVKDTNTLCGSIATMDYCIRHFLHTTGVSIPEALEAASLHPAQLLHIDSFKGNLCYGADADFVLLDQDLYVQKTYIAGEEVYSASNCPSKKKARIESDHDFSHF